MNIFVLSPCPILAARWQHDRHVVKMILESAQMLSTACQTPGTTHEFVYSQMAKTFPDPTLYKPTHANHPASVWVRNPNCANFVWLTIHMNELLSEYRRRFNRAHKCQRLAHLFASISGNMADAGFFTKDACRFYADATTQVETKINKRVYDFAREYCSEFVYCGPEQYKQRTVHDSYRTYYIAEKLAGNRWTRHATLSLPDWLMAANPTFVPPKWEREGKPTPKRVFAYPKRKQPVPSTMRLKLNLNPTR